LSALFCMPNALRMAFKGGTSLSKIYGTINRFSEDIDITIDYRELAKSLGDDFDPFAEGQSRNQINKFSDRLIKGVKVYTRDEVVPHLQAELNKLPNAAEHSIDVSEDEQEIYLNYPSEIEGDSYLLDPIKIELGGRNVINPNETHLVTAELAAHIDGLKFPSCEVVALSAERTFWEKVTLIHSECSRGEFKAAPERKSRHWYDLFVLLQSPIAQRAIEDTVLLEDVVRMKKCFYHASWANYEACMSNGFNLQPTNDMMSALKVDYQNMQDMIYGDRPSFDTVVNALTELEQCLND